MNGMTYLGVNDALQNVGLGLNTNLGNQISGELANISANKRGSRFRSREEMVDHLQELRNVFLQGVQAGVGSGVVSISSADVSLSIYR
jgi:hypothetical protein